MRSRARLAPWELLAFEGALLRDDHRSKEARDEQAALRQHTRERVIRDRALVVAALGLCHRVKQRGHTDVDQVLLRQAKRATHDHTEHAGVGGDELLWAGARVAGREPQQQLRPLSCDLDELLDDAHCAHLGRRARLCGPVDLHRVTNALGLLAHREQQTAVAAERERAWIRSPRFIGLVRSFTNLYDGEPKLRQRRGRGFWVGQIANEPSDPLLHRRLDDFDGLNVAPIEESSERLDHVRLWRKAVAIDEGALTHELDREAFTSLERLGGQPSQRFEVLAAAH